MALTEDKLAYHRDYRAANEDKVSESNKRWYQINGKKHYYENLELTRAIKRKCYYVSVGKQDKADKQQELIDQLRLMQPRRRAGAKVQFVGEEKISRRREVLRKARYRHVEGIPSYLEPEKCDVCGGGGKICMDHCHLTSRFRGWLCDNCNIAVGRAQEDPDILEKLAAYLREFRSNKEKLDNAG